VRRRPHLAKPTIEPLPPQIMSRYRRVTLAADVMYVNGIPMLVTISRNLRFATVEALPNRNISSHNTFKRNQSSHYSVQARKLQYICNPDGWRVRSDARRSSRPWHCPE
jgi:hypothetical protein